MKTCTGCGETKPFDGFPPDKAMQDGYRNQCRVCRRKTNRRATARWRAKNPSYFRGYYEKNREEMLAQQKARYDANPELFAERRREQYLRHYEAYRERSRRRYEENREECLAYYREWAREHPERIREHKRRSSAKRRARLTGLPNEDIDFQVVFERDQGTCGICGGPVDPDDWHLDHIVPIALGGPHLYSNVQVTHPLCNLSKGASLAIGEQQPSR